MIITCRNRISFLWIVLATLPWVAVIFKDKVMGIAFTFSMRKFVENPAALTFLLTIPWYISWIIPPVINFIADRIWTRWGRRKPFIAAAWIGTITSIACMPLAPDFGWLLVAYIAFSVFNDLGSPVESLKMEIVPPAQRATSQAVLSWIGNIASLTFWVVAIGRFDEMTTLFGLRFTGEQGLFWSVSLGIVVMLLFLTLGIKETNPHSALLGEKVTFRKVFAGLFDSNLWPVYILAFSVAILGTGLGAFNLLLITEQWGYTSQQLGTNIFVGGILNLFLIPLLGLLSNKVGRGRVYVGLVIAGIVVNASMYLYYRFVLYDSRPTLIEMIVFGEMLSVIGILTGMSLTPFTYDFIPRNELGTYAAGSGLVQRGTNILTTTLMGFFVWMHASLFLGPPGEMVRVSFKADTPQPVAQAALARTWTDPGSGKPIAAPSLTARPWYATGAVLDHGRGYEIRLRNADSAGIRDQRDRLETQRGVYRARKSYANNQLRALKTAEPTTGPTLASTDAAPYIEHISATPVPGDDNAVRLIAIFNRDNLPAADPEKIDPPPSTQPIADVRAYADSLIKTTERSAKAARASLNEKDKLKRLEAVVKIEAAAEKAVAAGVDHLDAILAQRAAAFQSQVSAALRDRLLGDGEEVLAAQAEPALIASFPLLRRPDPGDVERTIDRLRRAEPAAIDLRIVPDGANLALALSGRLSAASGDAAALATRLQVALTATAMDDLKAALAWPLAAPSVQQSQALCMDLRILEDPLDRHLSPITRAVNRVASVAIDPATPEQRLNALARNLRRPPPSDAKPLTAPAGVIGRLGQIAGAELAGRASGLYGLAVPAAREQRMTIARPILRTAFAAQQYDYLEGYVAVFVLQLVGLGITFSFLYLVRVGRVRRRGAEEAEAIV